MPLSCERCKFPDAFKSMWNIHLDFESMQFICSDCYVECPGLPQGELSSRERDGILACLIAEEVNVDPVCKKPLFDKRQLMLRYNSRTYYFCSERCREIFEARSALRKK